MKKLMVCLLGIVFAFFLLIRFEEARKGDQDLSGDGRYRSHIGKVFVTQKQSYIKRWSDSGKLSFVAEGTFGSLPKSYKEYNSNPEFWLQESGVEGAVGVGTRLKLTRVIRKHSDLLGYYLAPQGEILGGQFSGQEFDLSFAFESSNSEVANLAPDTNVLKEIAN